MRYLAIDLGQKRTGLATGDDVTGAVGPVGMIETADPAARLQAIVDAVAEHHVDALVVGVPYNMDGSIGAAAKQVEQFATELEQHTQMTVHRVDERLSSYEADEAKKQSGLTHQQKKRRRDALAAATILRDFLATQ